MRGEAGNYVRLRGFKTQIAAADMCRKKHVASRSHGREAALYVQAFAAKERRAVFLQLRF
jgi:hypothetical protein